MNTDLDIAVQAPSILLGANLALNEGSSFYDVAVHVKARDSKDDRLIVDEALRYRVEVGNSMTDLIYTHLWSRITDNEIARCKATYDIEGDVVVQVALDSVEKEVK